MQGDRANESATEQERRYNMAGIKREELFLENVILLYVTEYKKVKREKAELQKELEKMDNRVLSPDQHEKMKPVRMNFLDKCREEERLAKKIADSLAKELVG